MFKYQVCLLSVMTKKGSSVPKHIKEFYDRDKKIKKLLDTTEVVHSEAYHKGLEMIRDEKGKIDYDKLEEVKHQDAMLDKMIDHYLTKAVKALKLKEKPKDAVEQDIILQKYIGTTRGQLKRILREAKSGYTLKQHEQIRGSLIENQRRELMPIRHGHLEDEHLEDILKHTGTQDYVAGDRIRMEHAVSLLDLYKEKGSITLSDLKSISETPADKGGWASKVYLTDKAKKELKEMKQAHKT